MNYITPVVGAKEAAIAIDPELAENQLIFPERGDALERRTSSARSPAPRSRSTRREFQSILLGS